MKSNVLTQVKVYAHFTTSSRVITISNTIFQRCWPSTFPHNSGTTAAEFWRWKKGNIHLYDSLNSDTFATEHVRFQVYLWKRLKMWLRSKFRQKRFQTFRVENQNSLFPSDFWSLPWEYRDKSNRIWCERSGGRTSGGWVRLYVGRVWLQHVHHRSRYLSESCWPIVTVSVSLAKTAGHLWHWNAIMLGLSPMLSKEDTPNFAGW